VPRFFFHVRKGGSLIRDDEGTEAQNLEAAKEMALQSTRELLADEIKAGATDPIQSIIVADDSGNELLTITARDILPDSLK
jgi:hypothetical protein